MTRSVDLTGQLTNQESNDFPHEKLGTRVKICGIKRPEDASMAALAGADFVGIVFVPQRSRRVDAENAKRIISTLRETVDPLPKVVGLFADQSLEEVNRTVAICALDLVQLCGVESPEYCQQVETRVIKVVHVLESSDVNEAVPVLSQEMMALNSAGCLVTLDRKVEGLQGGTGRTFDWQIARALTKDGFAFTLAGGLSPENVAAAVRTASPWGVDVSSGVETRGVKDQEKVRAFVKAVRAAGTSGQ